MNETQQPLPPGASADDLKQFGKKLKTFALLLAWQIPALGVALAWWQNVLKNPIVAAGLVVGYEAAALIWKELGKPAWDAVWGKELRPQLVSGLTEWLNVTLRNLFSGFARRYRQQVVFDHREFPVRGLVTPGQGMLEIEKVFVELDIAPSHAMQVSANPLAAKTLPGAHPVWEFLRRLKKKQASALAILGPLGCGKTMLLKHIALTFAERKHRRRKLSAKFPILLFLREHAQLIAQDDLPLAEIAQHYFADPKRYPDLNPPPCWFELQLKAGRCLVLLDGLDEVLDPAQQQAVATWVDAQIRRYPRCRFVLTARPQGYRNNPLTRAQVLEVLPFTSEKASQFIKGWYFANKVIASGKADRGIRQQADRDAQDLLSRLEERPHLKELTVNPLLLTMIANVHNYRGKLPEQRVGLYAEICDVLFGHWQGAKGVSERMNAKQKRLALQPLAYAMMQRDARDIRTKDALAIMTEPLRQIGLSEADVPQFLAETPQATCGVLVEKEAGVWSFSHFTFQEYLCAAHWKETGEAAAWTAAEWRALIQESRWHETMRLYAAQADANLLVQTCLTLKTTPAIQLAADIAKEVLQLTPELRKALVSAKKALVAVRLRHEPKTVSVEEFLQEFQLNENRRPLEYIQNDYVDRGETVLDRATGLTWQKAGSPEELTYTGAYSYIADLNRKKFAGYDDWRLPTIPELMSLLEPEKQSNGFYLSPIFDVPKEKYYWEWSVDKRREKGEGLAESAWYVHFYYGSVSWGNLNISYDVRGVRS